MIKTHPELRQIAALPYIVTNDGSMRICLVTSRGNGNWIIPKGNLIDGLKPHEAAEQEAREEAGVIGDAEPTSIGEFSYLRIRQSREVNCRVEVYPMEVRERLETWDEMNDRSVLFCDLATALSLVKLHELAALMERYVKHRRVVNFRS
jgi:uncharacterized protein